MAIYNPLNVNQPGQRLLSLDFLRGLIMVILIFDEASVLQRLHYASPNSFTRFLAYQFDHSVWHGLRFWDLLLPSFMLITGTSMAYSYERQRTQLQYTWIQSFWKILKRSFWLLFWGILIYSVRREHLSLQFSNVLTQMAFTTLVAFLIIRWPVVWQLAASAVCLLIPEILGRYTHVPGFDQPFVDGHNFGNYIDLLLIKRVNPGYGTTLNCIPSAAYTIWGLMAGQMLQSKKTANLKLSCLTGFGLLVMLTGVGLDLTGITPILKWIASSSFVLTTGGISLITLAVCYGWIDVRQKQRYLRFFTIVGMNSIFIYLFYNFIGLKWLNGFALILISELLNLISIPVAAGAMVSSLVIFAFEWYLCYFLYKKKLFFKL